MNIIIENNTIKLMFSNYRTKRLLIQNVIKGVNIVDDVIFHVWYDSVNVIALVENYHYFININTKYLYCLN